MQRNTRSDRVRGVSIRAIALATLTVLSIVSLGPVMGAQPVATAASTATAIESCTTIDEPGRYDLTRSIENGTADVCIRIVVSDVTLDGRGHAVDGVDTSGGSIGILVNGRETVTNVTVRNVTVRNWDTGLAFGEAGGTGVEGGVVRNLTATDNGRTGLLVASGGENRFHEIAITYTNADNATILIGTTGNWFEGMTFRNTSTGWAVHASPGPDGTSSTDNTFVSPDFGFANASTSFTLEDAAVRPVPAGARPAPPSDQDDIGVYLNATNTSASGYLDLTVNYADGATTGAKESTLSVWRHDGSWSDRGGELDTGTNTLVKNITEFSVFAPLATDSPNFTVGIDATNSPVEEGEALGVTATVENTGGEAATQEVALTVGGTQRDVESVTLEGGESTSVTLSWTTEPGDAGNHTATVASPNDTDSTGVTVRERGFGDAFMVDIDETNLTLSGVRGAQNVEINVTVTNTGDQQGTQNVTLAVGGVQRDATNLTLGAGESQPITLTWETGDADAGTYNATVASEDDMENISVTVESPPAAAFLADTIEGYRGDVVTIPITLVNSEEGALAHVSVGSLGDSPYVTNLTVRDDNGDGNVTVLWNTHLAGTTDDESVAFSAAGDDSVTSVSRSSSQSSGHITPTDYPMSLTVGGTETDTGTLTLQDPAAVERSLRVSSAPGSREPSVRMAELAANASVTSEIAVAEGDRVVLFIPSAGLTGYIDGAEDLAGDGTEGVSLAITETSLGPNEEPDTVNVSSFVTLDGDFPKNGSMVFAADTSTDDFEIGETYRATFRIGEENPYFDSPLERTVSFRVEEPSADFTANNDLDGPFVMNGSFLAVGGVTNVAAGTNLTVQLRSTGGGEPFTLTKTVTTDANGDWTATFDFSEVPDGQSFTATVHHGDTGEILAEREGVIVANEPPKPSISYEPSEPVAGQAITFDASDSVDPDGEIVSVEFDVDGDGTYDIEDNDDFIVNYTYEEPGEYEVTLAVTDDDGATAETSTTISVESGAETATDQQGPGFGIAAATAAVLAAALLLVRRRR